MTEDDFLRPYFYRPCADREACLTAIRAFHAGEIADGTLDRRIAEALRLSVNVDTETDAEDGTDSPAFTIDSWARKVIDGKQYLRKSGPDVRFAFAMSNGMVLEARPDYETSEAYISSLRDIAHDIDPILPSNCGWQHGGGFLLYVYARQQAKKPLHKGYFGGYGYSVWLDGPRAVADAVLETLWRVHRNRDQAFAGLPWCGCCRRPLTDDTSRALGIGPDCARLLGIQHGKAPARTAKVAHEKARTGSEPMQARNNVANASKWGASAHE